jgi:chromate reductase
MADNTTKVLAFCGSLREKSYNHALLRAAMELAPPGMTITDYSIAGLPEYNDDVREKGYPEIVAKMRAAVVAADAILWVTPEYNYSIPGILKNAFDWLSRPPGPPLSRKACAIMSASQSLMGGVRAQYHLRQMLVFTDTLPVNKPEILVMTAQQKFDANLKLTDENTKNLIRQLLGNLADFAKVVNTHWQPAPAKS